VPRGAAGGQVPAWSRMRMSDGWDSLRFQLVFSKIPFSGFCYASLTPC
jgi:hypothetical protein